MERGNKHVGTFSFLFIFTLIFSHFTCYLSPASAGFMDHFARSDDIGEGKIPHAGSVRILVIPLDFSLPGFTPQNSTQLERFFGPARETAPTLAGYFSLNSGGAFHVEAEVLEPKTLFSCPFERLDPFACRLDDVTDLELYSWVPLVVDILDDLEQRGLDFTRFDLNGPDGTPDGWIDGVVIAQNGVSGDVSIPLHLLTSESVFGGVKIGGVAIVNNERPPDGDYTRNDAAFLREFGHLLGFADLTDTDGSSYGLAYSIMGAACADEESCDLPLLDAVSRVLIGWADPIEVHGEMDVLISPADSGGEIYQLGNEPRYFLVEHRRRHPLWDRRIQSPGLAVYRVNHAKSPGEGTYDFLASWYQGGPNDDEWDPFIMNIPADGKYELQFGSGWMDPDDLFTGGNILGEEQLFLFPDVYSSSGAPVVFLEVINATTPAPAIRALLSAPGTDETDPDLTECGQVPDGDPPPPLILLVFLILFRILSRAAPTRNIGGTKIFPSNGRWL